MGYVRTNQAVGLWHRQGLLQRVGRGLYAIPDRPVSKHGAPAEVARKHPHAIVCLLSALCLYELAT